MTDDPYLKKIVAAEIGHQKLRFRVAQDLFSSHEVDMGTRLLLRTLEREAPPLGSILDVGCGYGPIGVALARLNSGAALHMVDRDALAVEFARQNATLNGVAAEVYGSLGYDDVTARDFDLVASNIPAKAGEPVIAHLLRGAGRMLRPDGMAAVVVIGPIAATVAALLAGTPGIDITFTSATAGYSVLLYRFRGPLPDEPADGFERGVCDRGTLPFEAGGRAFALRTVWGLDEAEGPVPANALLLTEMSALAGHTFDRAVVLNPGQGYAAVALAAFAAPPRISLVDRDLLALRSTRRNLADAGFPEDSIDLTHAVGLPVDVAEGAALVLGVVREDEGPAAVNAAIDACAAALAPDGVAVLAGSSTAITRIEKHVEAQRLLRIQTRRRKKGQSVLVMRKP